MLVSIDLKSDLGIFKNPHFNGGFEGKSYSFDSTHKLSILGMLGSLIGLSGITSVGEDLLPEYYKKLNNVKTGIQILSDIKKEWLINNAATGMGHKEGNCFQYKTQILINPSYRIFLELDLLDECQNKVYSVLKNNEEGHFGNIYFGRSSFFAKRSNFREYPTDKVGEFEGLVKSLFVSDYSLVEKWGSDTESKFNTGFLFEDVYEHEVYERRVSLPNSFELQHNGTKIRYGKYINYVHTNKEVAVSGEFYKIDDYAIQLH